MSTTNTQSKQQSRSNHIVSLEVENFKRIKAARIEPTPTGAVIISGRNGQGKSSVLDAILAALGGKGNIDDVPVRVGQESATIAVTIDTDPPLVVERKIKADGKQTLTISHETPNGIKAKVARPQSVLDSLIGKVAFDPLAFTRLRPQEQVKLLADLVGVSTEDIDRQIEQITAERKEANAAVARARAQLESLPRYDDVPTEKLRTEDLLDELKSAQQHNERVRQSEVLRSKNAERLEAVRAQIAKLQEEEAELVEWLNAYEPESPVDTESIEARIAAVSEVNAKIDANRRRAETTHEVEQLEMVAETLTEELEAKRSRRLALMDSAKWPVPGLGFGDGGVTFNGLPFAQCSSAEQLRISTAIGLSQNAGLRLMIIRDGSLLDCDSLAAIRDLAAEHDAQVFVERVGAEPGTIIIEDGEVMSEVT